MEEDNMDRKGKYISDSPTKKIKLTLAELLYIDDTITMAVNGSEFEGMMPIRVPMPSNCTIVTIDFIDKIGKALLKAMKGGSVRMAISEADLYLLREIALSDVVHYGNRVGISLKGKVLNALYSKEINDLTTLEDMLRDIDLGE